MIQNVNMIISFLTVVIENVLALCICVCVCVCVCVYIYIYAVDMPSPGGDFTEYPSNPTSTEYFS
jgi:hypothetical protein